MVSINNGTFTFLTKNPQILMRKQYFNGEIIICKFPHFKDSKYFIEEGEIIEASEIKLIKRLYRI